MKNPEKSRNNPSKILQDPSIFPKKSPKIAKNFFKMNPSKIPKNPERFRNNPSKILQNPQKSPKTELIKMKTFN